MGFGNPTPMADRWVLAAWLGQSVSAWSEQVTESCAHKACGESTKRSEENHRAVVETPEQPKLTTMQDPLADVPLISPAEHRDEEVIMQTTACRGSQVRAKACDERNHETSPT